MPPSPPQDPTAPASEAPSPAPATETPAAPFRFRIVTWNVWWRHGPWQRRQPAILETLRRLDADVVTLQEAWGTPDGHEQAAELAAALGLHPISGLVERPDTDGLRIGNAILSRWPVAHAARAPLPTRHGPGADHRWPQVLLGVLDSPAGPLTVATTHLAARHYDSGLRQEQVRSAARFIAAEHGNLPHGGGRGGLPPLLTGDFNTVAEAEELRVLLGYAAVPVANLVFADAWQAAGDGGRAGATWDVANPHVKPWVWPSRRLDYVLVGLPPQGLPDPEPPGGPHYLAAARCWVAGIEPVGGTQPSDHYAVAADLLAFPGPGGGPAGG